MIKQNKTNLAQLIFYAVLILVLFMLPRMIESRYFMQLANTSIIFFIIVMGLNFVIGFSGQISLASTAFWGIGAYTSAILTTRFGVSFWIALPISAIVAMLVGFITGYPALRLSKFYLGIATVGIGEIISLVLLNWTSMTNGSDGIPGIPRPRIGSYIISSNFQFFYLFLIIAIILFIASVKVKHSRFGRGLLAIKNNEIAAAATGIPTHRYKTVAFALSALYAGIAGSLYAHLIGFISPDLFVFRQTVVFLCMFMIGGAGSLIGPAIGSVLLTLLPEFMRFMQAYYMAFYGLLVALLAIVMPKGISGLIERFSPRLYVFLEPYAVVPKTVLERGFIKWKRK